jgi:hypothetical protein
VQSGYEKVVEALLGMGAAVQLKAGKFGETPLHTASRIPNGRLCVEMLIKSGAQINAIEDVRQKFSLKYLFIFRLLMTEYLYYLYTNRMEKHLFILLPDSDFSKQSNYYLKIKPNQRFRTTQEKMFCKLQSKVVTILSLKK